MRERHSARMPFDDQRKITDLELTQLLEAARWAPTAHNMQNFEIVVVDDRVVLDAIGRIRTETTDTFIRENYAQLSFSEEELQAKGTGLPASQFPPAWRHPDARPSEVVDLEHAFLGGAMHNAPMLLIVAYDSRKRAPASEHDVLGFMSLGCVMENMWLMAEELGIGMQILSAFAGEHVESELRRILALPAHMKVAFACRLGHPAALAPQYLRVRRSPERFAHRNCYGDSLSAAETAKEFLS
jgi:nitroreductase